MLELSVLRCARKAGVFLFTVGLAAGVFLVAPPSAEAQGLFEALFGRSEASFAPTITIPFTQRRNDERVTSPRKSLSRSPMPQRARNEVSQPPAPYRAPEVMPGPLGQFLRDPALRPGDVVVTADGLMVFRGPSGARHRASQFVPVGQAGPLVASRIRAELAKVVVAARLEHSPTPTRFVESSSPIVAQDDGVRLQ